MIYNNINDDAHVKTPLKCSQIIFRISCLACGPNLKSFELIQVFREKRGRRG